MSEPPANDSIAPAGAESTAAQTGLPSTGRERLEAGILTATLVAACTQWALGGQVDKTGEQIGPALPLATIVLGLAFIAVLIVRRELRWPHLRWPHVVALCTLPIGLLGLSRTELFGGIKEMVQLAEILVISWYLTATTTAATRRVLARCLGYVTTGLLVFGVAGLHRIFGLSEARYAGLLVIGTPFLVYAWHDRQRLCTVILLLSGLILGLWLKNGGLLLVWLVVVHLAAGLLQRKLLPAAGATAVLAIVLTFPAPGAAAWDSLNPRYDKAHRKRLFIEYEASLQAPKFYPVGGGLGEYKRTINVLKLELDDEAAATENKIPGDSNCQYLLTLVEAGLPAALGLLVLFGGMLFLLTRCRPEPYELRLRNTVVAAVVGLLLAGLFTTTLGRGIGIWTGLALGLATALTADARAATLPGLLLRLAPPALVEAVGLAGILLINTTPDKIAHVSVVNQKIRQVYLDENAMPDPADPPPGKTTDTGLQIVKLGDDDDGADTDSRIRVEGESFKTAGPTFRAVKANDTSGNQALEIPDESGKGAGEAVYEFDVPQAGDFALVARVWWKDGCGNSLTFVVNGDKQKVSSERFEVWHDLPTRRPISLAAGKVTVIVRNVEDGIRLDYFELRPISAP